MIRTALAVIIGLVCMTPSGVRGDEALSPEADSGACCLPDSTCVMVAGAAECAAFSGGQGQYWGDGTSCVDIRIDSGVTPPGAVCGVRHKDVATMESLAACSIAKTNWLPKNCFTDFSLGDAVATYFDPASCPGGGATYPFEITSVSFILTHG